MDRQGSVLSTLSDYDLLDTTNEELDEPISNGEVQPEQSFLKKNRDIYVKVSVREGHGFIGPTVRSSTRLYDVECYHSGFHWRVTRNYSQFEELHRALVFYRASLRLNRTNAKKKEIVKTVKAEGSRRQKPGRIRNKSLKFPNKPEIFVFSASQIEQRRRQLEDYLNAVLKDPRYKTHDATMRFVEVSPLSFRKHSGDKFHEGFVKKRSGGRRFSSVLACVVPSAALWNKRWLVLKDSYICYLRSDNVIADVMLFDQDFGEVKAGLAHTKIRHGILFTNTTRELALKTNGHHKTRNWTNAIQQVAEACEYIHRTPHESFAPQRKELAHWYVDAVHYFEDVASALQSAREEIFITDWWLTPELFLRRPVVHMGSPSRLDKILHSKAEQGVKIYILLYKEIEMAVGGICSFKCKNYLESLHPNIKVMRHPDHIKSSVYLWTHHEKIVCIDQTIAFLGGLDLCFGRWDNFEHRLTDLGSVQTVTPPSSRPASTACHPDEWKGVGVEDLIRQRKRELSGKGSRRISSSETTSSINSLAMVMLGSDMEALTRAMTERSRSASDATFVKLTDHEMSGLKCNSVAVGTSTSFNGPIPLYEATQASIEHDNKPNSVLSAKQADGGILGDTDSSLCSPNLSNGEKTAHDIGASADVKSDLRPEVLGMKFSGVDSEYDSINSELVALPFEAPGDICPSMGFGDKSSCDRLSSIIEYNSIRSAPADDLIVNPVEEPKSESMPDIDLDLISPDCLPDSSNDLELASTPDNGDTMTTHLKHSSLPSNVVSTHVTACNPTLESDPTDLTHEPAAGLGAEGVTCNRTPAALTTSGELVEAAESPVFPLYPQPVAESAAEVAACGPTQTSACNSGELVEATESSVFPLYPQTVAESVAEVLVCSPTQASVFPSQEAAEANDRSTMEVKENDKSLLLEPVQGFSYIEPARRKKSRSKVPTRPPEAAYLKRLSDPSAANYAHKGRANSIVKSPPNQSSSSWKKIRNNLDKVKRVWTHEESMRRTSEQGSLPDSSGSTPEMERWKSSMISGGAIASKYWLGKDYVNWIHKDLTSVEAPFHDSVDRFSTVRMPWHDIACVIFNKAATDIGRHFIQRWNFAKKVKDSTKSSNKYPLLLPRSTNVVYKRLPPFIRERCELVNCQILRSCAGWSSGMHNPETSIYNAYMSLIAEAEHYIYIENQFFISWCGTDVQNCVCEALVNRILKAHKANKTFRVYMVLPLLPAFEADLDPHKSGGSPLFSILHYVQQSLVGHDNSLFQTLHKHGLDPTRYVYVCGLRNHGILKQVPVTELIYVHSKLMIVDDKKCIIGSANINDRSLAGDRDSEIAVLIQDEFFTESRMSGQEYQAGKFCYSLRNDLFQEHLGLRPDEFIQDITCEEFYKKTWVTTAVHNTTIYEKVFNCLPCDSVTSFEQLRLHRQQVSLASSDPVAAKMQLSKVKGHLVMYPLQFLKNEILRNHMGTKETLVPNRFWT